MANEPEGRTPSPGPFPAGREGENREEAEYSWQSPYEHYQGLQPKAREMRKNPTPAESRLWDAIRMRKIDRIKFRRQHSIGQFIVDFYSNEAKLIIEVDGSSHNGKSDQDAARQQFLEQLGFRVIRFTNDEIMNSLDTVIQQIHSITSSPSLQAAPMPGLSGKGPGDGVNQ